MSGEPNVVVGIYRRENSAHVRRLVAPALEQGWHTRWWGLDGVHPDLADVTAGEGPGLKLPLLNRLLEGLGEAASWTLLSDDDFSFVRGDVVELVVLCERAELDLAQPARSQGTNMGHGITAERARSIARLTTFVESGPLVVIGPRFRDSIVPLPEWRGMGWGVELDWMDLRHDGCRLGIVDGASIEHLGDAGQHYDTTEIRRAMLDELGARGVNDWKPLQETISIWRPWQRRPPWQRRESAGRRNRDDH